MSDDAADHAIDLFARGELSASMAAMRVVLATADGTALAAALGRAQDRLGAAVTAPIVRLISSEAEARVRAVAAALDHTFHDPAPETVFARIAAGFDAAVAVSPEVSVALYSFGDPAVLAAATAEVVAWLRAEGLLTPGLAVLDVGCGTGRFLQALAEQADVALGVEISLAMAGEARRRVAGMPRVGIVRGSGLDLDFVADTSVDLVLFADSFPYAVQAGGDVPLRLLSAVARVLRPGGRAAVLNWSYRDDPARDATERAGLLHACGLEQQAHHPAPFRLWDATATILRRP